MKNTKIIFVRHGQSLGNAAHVLLGHTDLDLSEVGYKQARLASDALGDEPIDLIFSSDLIRAYNTARPFAERRGLQVISDSGFREIFLGDWENRPTMPLREAKDPLFEDFCFRFGYFCAPNGESASELGDRIYAHTLDVARRYPGKTLLVAAHAAAIRTLFGRILGYGPDEISNDLPFPTNASFSVCEFDGERLFAIEFSRDGHIISELGIPSAHLVFEK